MAHHRSDEKSSTFSDRPHAKNNNEAKTSDQEKTIHRRNSLTTRTITVASKHNLLVELAYNNTMFVSQVSATSVRRGVAYTQRFALARGFTSTAPSRADQYDVVIIGRCMFGKVVSLLTPTE